METCHNTILQRTTEKAMLSIYSRNKNTRTILEINVIHLRITSYKEYTLVRELYQVTNIQTIE